MNNISKISPLLIMAVAIAVFSFLTGELIGMKSGYAYTRKGAAPMDAAYTVSVINLIESGMSKEAKEMLETKMDNYIIDHWSASRCRLIGLNPFIKENPQNEMFYTTISHRKSNPSENELIQNYLKRLEEEI